MVWLSKYKKNTQKPKMSPKVGQNVVLVARNIYPRFWPDPISCWGYKNIYVKKEIDSGTPNYSKMLFSGEIKDVRWVLIWCQFGGDKLNICSPSGGSKSSKEWDVRSEMGKENVLCR